MTNNLTDDQAATLERIRTEPLPPRTCTTCPSEYVPEKRQHRRCPSCRARKVSIPRPSRLPRTELQVRLKSTKHVDALVSLDQAIAELGAAQRELRVHAEEAGRRKLNHYEQERLLIEPLSRLNLAQRFIASTLRTYGYKPLEDES